MTWKTLLRAFTGLALCWAGAERLLREGRLKETARMAFGLLTMMLWLHGLQGILPVQLPDAEDIEQTLLQPVAGMQQPVPPAWRQHLERSACEALRRRGCQGTVEMELDETGALTGARFRLTQGETSAARAALAEALGLAAEKIRQE